MKLNTLFKKPSARSIAQIDLEEAERQVLIHSASANYHAKMTDYYKETVQRLTEYIKEPTVLSNGQLQKTT